MHKSLQLILKLVGLVALAGIPYYLFLSNLITNYDPFYWKSTYASPTLIIGVSRAAQGIAPQVLEEELELEDKALNFAFTGMHTPYGAPYLKLIKRKIADDKGPGLFILSVHPGNVADLEGGNGKREQDFRFYDMWCVNCDPNPEYIIRNINGELSLLPVLITKIKPSRPFDTIHHNGWIERTTPERMRQRAFDDLKIMDFEPVLSSEREQYLEKTVEYLAQHGQVVLVRMPVNAEAKAREDAFFTNFDALMAQIAEKYGASYLDFSGQGEDYEFNDGIHHLDGPSARRFTKRLAEEIRR